MNIDDKDYGVFRVELVLNDEDPFKTRDDVAKALNLVAFSLESSLNLEGLIHDADGEVVGQWHFVPREGEK